MSFRAGLCAAVLVSVAFSGCGPKEEAAAPKELVTEEPAATESGEPEREAPPAEPPSPPAEAEPAPPQPMALEALCQSKCDRLKTDCKASAVDKCRANCEQWTRTPEPCVSTSRAALECERDATELGCAPIVPESCGKHFVEVTSCRDNPSTFTPAPVETASTGLPAGWEKVTDAQAGFTATMPAGATLDTAGGRTWRATGADGVSYTVRVLAPLAKTPDAKAWIKVSGEALKPCDQKTRLHGLIEKPDFISMRYDSKCEGSGERHGSLVVLPKAFVVTAIEGPTGEQSQLFLFGLEPL